MKNNRRMLLSILWVFLGIGLVIATQIAELDEFWSGMGSAFVFVGALQIFRWIKYSRDAQYREKVDVEQKDERNRFLSAKAWGWAGYLFVLISAVASMILRIAGQILLSYAASGALCLILVLYWVSYLIVRKKY